MYTQFFGNYLLSHQYITNDQLFTAMQKVSEKRMKLGTLAIHNGYMTAEEVDDVLSLQTKIDKKFGEIAIDQGYLTNDQVVELLRLQSPDFLLIGQTLVEDGIFSNQELENVITDYYSENEIYDLDINDTSKELITKIFEHFFVVSEHPVTAKGKMYMELFFNNMIRFIGDDFTPVHIEACTEFPTVHCSYQKVCGDYSLVSYMDMDDTTAIEFASRYANDCYDTYNEYVQAALEDFLNLQNGLFAVNVSNESSCELSLTPPEFSNEGLLIFDHPAYHFPILYSFGTIHVILEIIHTGR